MTETTRRPHQGKVAKDLNESIRYTMWSVFRLGVVLGDTDRAAEANEVENLCDFAVALGFGGAAVAQGIGHVLTHRHMRPHCI